MEDKINNSSKKNNKKIYIIIAGVIILLIAIGIFVYSKITEDNCTNTNLPNNKNGSSTTSDPIMMVVYKPIIYLYPTEETEVKIDLGYSEKILCSYPEYTNGWNVVAKTNGDLINLDNGKNLYSLYYESTNVVDFDCKKDGFIVKGSEISEFLEEKLSILGLTEREAEEFIIYWLPKLQENEYNYIRFATFEEINTNMPLKFSVEPDTLIRVLMTYKGLDNPIDVQEQKLETPIRTGFVAVEWGGTEIK